VRAWWRAWATQARAGDHAGGDEAKDDQRRWKAAVGNAGGAQREPDLLAARDVRPAISDLRTPELKGADPGLDLPFGPAFVPNDTLPTIRQPPLSEPVSENPISASSALTSIRRASSRTISVSGSSTEPGRAQRDRYRPSWCIAFSGGSGRLDTRHDTPLYQLASQVRP